MRKKCEVFAHRRIGTKAKGDFFRLSFVANFAMYITERVRMYARGILSLASPLAFGNLRVLGCPGPFTSAVSREIKARPPPFGSARLVSVRLGEEGSGELGSERVERRGSF